MVYQLPAPTYFYQKDIIGRNSDIYAWQIGEHKDLPTKKWWFREFGFDWTGLTMKSRGFSQQK
jgi:hypothetical protein